MDKKAEMTEEVSEVYLSWSSPSRPFKQRNNEYFRNVGAIVFLLTVILVFAKEFVLVAAVLSIVFLIYVLSTVPPENVEHRVTNLGIESAGHFYRYDTMKEFWFEEQWGQTLLIISPNFGPHTVVLLGEANKDKVREAMAKHIPFREQPEKTWVDSASHWLSEKVPLENPS